MNVETKNNITEKMFAVIEAAVDLACAQVSQLSTEDKRDFGRQLIKELREVADTIEKEILEPIVKFEINHVTHTRLQDDGCPHEGPKNDE